MGQTDGLLRCSIGHASFTLTDYAVRIEPIAEEITTGPGAGTGLTRRGRRYTINAEGYIAGTDAAEYAEHLMAAQQAMRTSGRDFIVYGLAGHKEFELLAAWVVDGGPHVTVELGRQSGSGNSALRREVRLTIQADTIGGEDGSGGGSEPVSEAWRISTAERADGLLTVTRGGEMRGVNLSGHFDAATVAQFRAAYPPPHWVVELRKEVDATGGRLRYELSAIQLADPLPQGVGYAVHDGTRTERRDSEVNWRLIQTYSWDLLVSGDPMALERDLRPQLAPNQVFLRESIEVQGLRERRLRATYTILTSTHSTGWLLDWSQTMDIPREVVPRIGREFDGGGSPLIHYGPAPVYRYVQRGRAVGLKQIPSPAPPVLGFDAVGRQPRLQVRALNPFEWEITWEYEFLLTSPRAVDVQALNVPTASPYQGGT